MSDISTLIEKYNTIFVVPLVVGLAIAAWGGTEFAKEHEKKVRAYENFQNETIGSRAVTKFIENDVNRLLLAQRAAVGNEQAKIWSKQIVDDFKENLKRELKTSPVKKAFEDTQDNTMWWSFLGTTVFGTLLAVFFGCLIYRRERDDRARKERIEEEERQRQLRKYLEEQEDRDRKSRARAVVEGRRNA